MLTILNLGAFATYQINVEFSNNITESIGEEISSDYVIFRTLKGGGKFLLKIYTVLNFT